MELKQLLSSKRLSTVIGIIGPLLFVTLFTLEGLFRTGYNPTKMFISELSLGDSGWMQIINFIIVGLSLLIFSRSIPEEFKTGRKLIKIIGFSLLISGPFVMEPTSTPLNQLSFHGLVHSIFGAVVFTLIPITCFVFFRYFSKNSKWHNFKWITLMTAMITTIFVILLTALTKNPSLANTYGNWQGFVQRGVIIPFMFWLPIFALKLYNKRVITS